MEWFKKLASIKEIPDLKFEGYMWASDKDAPELIISLPTEYESGGNPSNPFIMEAYLYCSEENTSVSVRHVSGKNMINIFYLNNIEKGSITEKKYIGHSKLKNDLNFCEIWQKEKDEYCCNMEVLIKKAVVFNGFQKLVGEK